MKPRLPSVQQLVLSSLMVLGPRASSSARTCGIAGSSLRGFMAVPMSRRLHPQAVAQRAQKLVQKPNVLSHMS
eukprot:734748-Amphidinium_carterae.1